MTAHLNTFLSVLGFIVSIYSLWMARSARGEARNTSLLELVHKKRMVLVSQFSDISSLINDLKYEDLEDKEARRLYNQIKNYRNQLIEAMNSSSELMVDPQDLDKKRLLNEISDFNLMHAIHKSTITELDDLIRVRNKS